MIKNLIFTAVLAFIGLAAQAQTPLKRGTSVPIRFTSDLSSKKNAPEAQVVIARDVVVGKDVVIKGGTPVTVNTEKQPARGCGRAGSLQVSFISTQAVDGTTINLYGGSITREGKDKKGLAIGLGVGLGCFTAGPLLALLAIKGGQAVIPVNTVLNNVTVADDYEIIVK